jgi:sugar phosphate isomerase/epimerase
MNIGLIGIVNEEAKRDFWATMEAVARIGYQGIEGCEGALLTGDVAENLKRFHGLDLRVLTVSASQQQLRDDLDGVRQRALAVQSPRVTVWWSKADSKESLLADAALYNTAGTALAQDGIQLCYHNHEQEFRNRFDGVYALDILALNTDPAALHFNIDIAWVAFGGEDPVRVLERLAGRVPAIHVKDLWDLSARGRFTAVGTGVVPVQASIRAAAATGVEWMVIEQDTLRNLNALDTITLSYLYLKEAGLVDVAR